MTSRQVLARVTVAVMLVAAAGVLVAPGAGAAAPCWQQPVPPPDCPDPPPPPPPPPPGPIARDVRVYGSGAALPAIHTRLDEVLDRVASTNRARLVGKTVRVHVIPQNGQLTDLPLWSDKQGERVPDYNPNDSYVENRMWDDVRGVFRTCSGATLDVAVGEETVTDLRDPPAGQGYRSPADNDLGRILVHEIGHALECGLTPTQRTTLTTLYNAAYARYPTNVGGVNPAYTVSRATEYIAEATTAWFQAGANSTYRRAWVDAHDPGLYDLLDAVFAIPPAPRHCDGERATAVITTSGGTFTGPYYGGRDVVVGSPGSDVIDVGTGDDLVCAGGGDDTVRGGHLYDYLYGEAGNDELHGGNSDDHLFGGTGNDTYYGDSSNDTLSETGGNGNDVLYGGAGNDVSAGYDGVDVLWDDVGRDELIGGADSDWLIAQDADGVTPDSLYGDLNSNDTDPDACAADPTDTVVAC
jgi:hypothetical protein